MTQSALLEHVWDDVEGVQYHYPAKYQSKIKTGEAFVDDRGVHRVGGKRGAAEYVGAGRVGKIWLDPSAGAGSRRKFDCAIAPILFVFCNPGLR